MNLMKPFAILIALMAISACTSAKHSPITQDDLMRNTQEMFDSVAAGDQTPWKKYFAEDSIKLVKAKSHIEGDTAILSYDLDETETIFGQNMTARYHGTDTWRYRNGKWQIIAGQMFRYYEDPAPGKVNAKTYAEYVGTYELAPGVTQAVSLEGDSLYAQRKDSNKVQLVPEATGIFFRKGIEGRRLFQRDDRGKVDAMIDRRNNEDVVWKKVK